MLLLASGQAARDPLPQVPPFRAPLDRTRVTQLGGQHAPETVDPHLVTGIAEAGTEEEPGQVQPARLVLRRPAARGLERPERVPQRADGAERPRIPAGIERHFETTGERHRIVRTFEGRAQQGRRRLDPARVDDHRRVRGWRRLGAGNGVAQPEFEPPAVLGLTRATPELERADLGQTNLEVHGQHAIGELPAEADDRPQRRQRRESGRIDDVASVLAAPIGRRVERERDGPIGHELELPVGDLDGLALLHAARHDAQRGRRRAAEPDVVRARRAAADADAEAAPDQAEVRRAARDSELERLRLELRRLPVAGRGMPGADDCAEPLAHHMWLERAAVEEDRIGPRERQLRLPRRLALPAEKLRDVPRDLRLGGERQAPLARREVRGRPRPRGGGDGREEAVEHDRLHLGARERRREGAADDTGPASRHRDPRLDERRVGQELLLGGATAADERVKPRRVEGAAGADARLDRARERDVHVVPAEEQVLSHRHAFESELAAARARRDQRQVGGAAADVDHEDERMRRHAGTPVRLVAHEPGVERGLWLFEEDDVGKAGVARRRERQLARHLVERGGHREHHVLRGERLGEARVPCLAQVAEDAGRGVDGRDARHALGRAPGEDRRRPVDPAVAEPRLGRGDEPSGHSPALLARQEADAEVAARGPRKIEALRRQIVRSRQIDERRQRRAGRSLAGCQDLRHVENADRSSRPGVDPRARRVRRAKVDADDEAGRRHAATRSPPPRARRRARPVRGARATSRSSRAIRRGATRRETAVRR